MENEHHKKHLTLQERIEIQEFVSRGMTFKEIAWRIGKDPTTVSREVRKHAEVQQKRFTRTEETCPKLLRPPFVCNGCDQYNRCSCVYLRKLYVGKRAQCEYETTLKESREGIPLNKESFYQTEKIISDGVRSGQNVYHIIHANHLSVSKSTVYRHIRKGYYAIAPIDLPRAVKFKSRRKHAPEYVPQGIRKGRTYKDFEDFMREHPGVSATEMDTVIGSIGGKVIMTFQFTHVDFMFGLLLENKSAAEAAEKITAFKKKLAAFGFSFGEFFPVLLTDNGGEFSCVSAFENSIDEEKETSVFFCDPNAPYQKPHVENNHTLFRNIVPTGSSFDGFTQETVNLIFSHVNGVLRNKFHGKSAYDMFCFTYSAELAHALGISCIAPQEVVQSPLLLK
ncbi:MAG: IS30 family transposase [Clostridia bacterium]|nr:IS30 family transposase [Clostridia bacterium]